MLQNQTVSGKQGFQKVLETETSLQVQEAVHVIVLLLSSDTSEFGFATNFLALLLWLIILKSHKWMLVYAPWLKMF